MLLNALASLGHKGIKTLRTFGRAGLMLFNALVGKPEFRKHAPLLVRQLYNVGVLSMLIIVVSGVFIGMVLGLQGYLVLTTYSAETSLGMLVALSLLRELGPVVAALLFAGRAGSALTAEIGLMRATEQLSSMEMMAVDPLRRVRRDPQYLTLPAHREKPPHKSRPARCSAQKSASPVRPW